MLNASYNRNLFLNLFKYIYTPGQPGVVFFADYIYLIFLIIVIIIFGSMNKYKLQSVYFLPILTSIAIVYMVLIKLTLMNWTEYNLMDYIICSMGILLSVYLIISQLDTDFDFEISLFMI
jgi:hypothetical protein